MEITPTLGFGDLLIWKLYSVNNNVPIKTINVNKQLIREYDKYPEKALENITYIINSIFPDTEINIIESSDLRECPSNNNFYQTYIYDNVNFGNKPPINIDGDYVVFHTKVNYDSRAMEFFIKNCMYPLSIFLQRFKISYKIVILGERTSEECYEYKFNNDLQSLCKSFIKNKNIKSHKLCIYNFLLKFLNKNNTIIDLTGEDLYSDDDTIGTLTKYIEIINKAKCNISIGAGSPLTMCQLFSKHNISYVSGIYLSSIDNYYTNIKMVYRQFINSLKSLNEDEHSSSKLLLITHQGLGDMINTNGAINFFSVIYDEIFIISRVSNYENVKQIYSYNSKVNILKNNANDDILNIYKKFTGDIINMGFHDEYTNRISNKNFSFKIKPDVLSSSTYFLYIMYRKAGLNMSIYHNYFYLESNQESKNLYALIKHYNITFIHEESSEAKIDIKDKFNLNNENDIVICANRNYYSVEDSKYELANKFVNIPIMSYYDTIVNSSVIHIVDSCFSSVIIPLVNKGIIKTDQLFLYERECFITPIKLCSKFKHLTI